MARPKRMESRREGDDVVISHMEVVREVVGVPVVTLRRPVVEKGGKEGDADVFIFSGSIVVKPTATDQSIFGAFKEVAKMVLEDLDDYKLSAAKPASFDEQT